MTSLWNSAYLGCCMKDVLYIAVALAFFAACWYLTRACEKL
jgi:hypothetical protein